MNVDTTAEEKTDTRDIAAAENAIQHDPTLAVLVYDSALHVLKHYLAQGLPRSYSAKIMREFERRLNDGTE